MRSQQRHDVRLIKMRPDGSTDIDQMTNLSRPQRFEPIEQAPRPAERFCSSRPCKILQEFAFSTCSLNQTH